MAKEWEVDLIVMGTEDRRLSTETFDKIGIKEFILKPFNVADLQVLL